MNNNIYRVSRRLFFSALIAIPSSLLTSCSEDVNQWPVDSSYDRLYQTTHFDVEETEPTSVILKFNGITDATKYVFEFSIDKVDSFDNIVLTEEVKADTLKPFSEGKVISQNEYKKKFEDLAGTTQYSVRVKGVNELSGIESKWHHLSFKTPAEQIFTSVTPGIKDVLLNWQADKVATDIHLSSIVGTDTTEINHVELSASQIADGEISFADLNPGSKYMAQIMNGEFLRGTLVFNTLGSSEGIAIEVNDGDDISTLLAETSAETVTLIFKGGVKYELGNLTIPATVKNLFLSGSIVDGQRAELHIPSASLTGPMDNFHIQYVDVNAQGGFWLRLSGDNVFKKMYITGSVFRNLNNCIVYASATGEIEGIYVDNSILDHVSTGGWGMFNITGSTKMRELSITNTTIKEVGDQWMDIRVPLELIKIDHVTFCNYQVGLPKLVLINKQPGEMIMTNNIFAGTNTGQKMNHGYGNYSSWLDFSGCFMTSDFPEGDKKFGNITHLNYTTEELFVDPQNGDFHMNENVTFRGKGKVGDPHWW